MRMIGIGLLAFVLAAAAFALSYFTMGQQGWRRVTEVVSGPYLVFETGSRPKPAAGSVRDKVEVTRMDVETPAILSGLPAYQAIMFPMPVNARPVDGELILELTSQVLPQVEAVLRVNIANVRRAEVLLQTGDSKRTISIPLNTRELSAKTLPVALSLQGKGPSEPCGDAGISAVVEIESSSTLKLNLDQTMVSPVDQTMAAGNQARISWTEDLSEEERRNRLVAAMGLVRQKQSVSFHASVAEGMLDTKALASLAAMTPAPVEEDEPDYWPRTLADDQNRGLRKFRGSTTWRHRYDLREAPERRRAVALELDMLLGPLPPEVDWTVSATVNGKTLVLDRVPGGTDYKRFAVVPAQWQGAENTVEVSATAAINPAGVCNDGPLLMAELRENSRLIGGGPVWGAPIYALHDWLESTGPLAFSSTPLTPSEAGSAAELLAAAIPPTVTFSDADSVVRVEVIGRGRATETGPVSEAWLVLAADDGYSDPIARQGVVTVPSDAPVTLRFTFPQQVADVAVQP